MYTLYSVLCTHCTVFTLYSVHLVQCTPCTVYTLYSIHLVQCSICTVFILYSAHLVKYAPGTLYILHRVHLVQCKLCTVHLGVSSQCPEARSHSDPSWCIFNLKSTHLNVGGNTRIQQNIYGRQQISRESVWELSVES